MMIMMMMIVISENKSLCGDHIADADGDDDGDDNDVIFRVTDHQNRLIPKMMTIPVITVEPTMTYSFCFVITQVRHLGQYNACRLIYNSFACICNICHFLITLLFCHQNTFRTPVYTTSQRRNAMGVGLVFEADLSSLEHDSHWVLQGVCLTLNSD